MLILTNLYIYPIKSLGGIAVDSAVVTSRGLQYDRRWMLIDDNNQALTQRQFPQMALLQVALLEEGLTVHHKNNPAVTVSVPYPLTQSAGTVTVQIWDDICEAQLASNAINNWFSKALQINCRLVYMPETTTRMVDKNYAANQEITSFSDGYPLLIIGQSSLDELNTRLTKPLPMNRFRPNIVFTGGEAFKEDAFDEFTINGIQFFGVKLCARCVVTTINQDDAGKGKEPLKTLSTYRMKHSKIYFGQNLLHRGTGVISVGDAIHIQKLKAGF